MPGNPDARATGTVLRGVRENLDVIVLKSAPSRGIWIPSDTQLLGSTGSTTQTACWSVRLAERGLGVVVARKADLNSDKPNDFGL